ncbi:hypothetical protein BB560_006211, partial [Smittium megazygosporum]
DHVFNQFQILQKNTDYRTRISKLDLMISQSNENSDSKIYDWNKNNMLLDDRITEYNQRMEKSFAYLKQLHITIPNFALMEQLISNVKSLHNTVKLYQKKLLAYANLPPREPSKKRDIMFRFELNDDV